MWEEDLVVARPADTRESATHEGEDSGVVGRPADTRESATHEGDLSSGSSEQIPLSSEQIPLSLSSEKTPESSEKTPLSSESQALASGHGGGEGGLANDTSLDTSHRGRGTAPWDQAGVLCREQSMETSTTGPETSTPSPETSFPSLEVKRQNVTIHSEPTLYGADESGRQSDVSLDITDSGSTRSTRSATASLTLEQKVALFARQRKSDGERRYNAAAKLATTVFCLGIANVGLACLLWYYEYITPYDFFYLICPGFFFLPMSLLILTMVPADVVDLDVVLRKFLFHRVALGVLLGVPACCLAYVIQPHIHITMVLVLFLLLPPRPWASRELICSPTTALRLYLHCLQFSSCVAMIFFAERPNDSYLSVLILRYRIVRERAWVGRYVCNDDATWCNSMLPYFHTTTWVAAVLVALASVLTILSHKHVVSSTIRCYDTANMVYLGFGTLCGCPSVVLLALGAERGGPLLTMSVFLCLPTLVVVLFGKDVVFGWLAYRFEGSRAEEDGAFVAELMDQRDVAVGHVWWIHHGLELAHFKRGDPRRNFREGQVVRMTTLNFVVHLGDQARVDTMMVTSTGSVESSIGRRLVRRGKEMLRPRRSCQFEEFERVGGCSIAEHDGNDRTTTRSTRNFSIASFWNSASPRPADSHAQVGSISGDLADELGENDVVVPLGTRCMHATEILAKARQNLRCIEWEKITLDLMSRATDKLESDPDLYDLSRPVAPGEKITYFMSHSWYDDASAKFQALQDLSESYKQQHGKFPTFWLDKVCIDQNNISDGLKVLPVNVMACKQMLVLCGSTYTQRLWCAWELCTLVSFMRMRQAADRLLIIQITEQKQAHPSRSHPLTTFDCRKAHCYDPNEEAVLRKIIRAVGNDVFNSRIRELSKTSLAKRKKPTLARQASNTLARSITSCKY